jgi:hypothetical protein
MAILPKPTAKIFKLENIISVIILGSFFVMAAPPIYTQSLLLVVVWWFAFHFPTKCLLYVYF